MKVVLSQETSILLQYCSKIALEKNVKPFTNWQWHELQEKLDRYQQTIFSFHDLSVSGLRDMLLETKEIQKIMDLRRGVLSAVLTYNDQFDLQILSYLDTMIYPNMLRKKQKKKAPVLFFCIGNLDLLLEDVPKLAVVGMRDCEKQTEENCRKIVKECIDHNICIVSGGARGVDDIARETVSQQYGSMIFVLPYGVLTKEAQRIQANQKGKFLIVSMEEPHQQFHSYQALKRNSLIYALSSHALIMQAGNGTGGTWQGATEALRECLCKIGVWNNEALKGNQRLAHMGAKNLTEKEILSWFYHK